jgi:hypothetical protein
MVEDTKIRKFDLLKDYDMLYKWWKSHGSFPPEPEHLSPTGLVVEVEGNPVTAGFLYNTDSKICVFEFVIADPDANKKVRAKALNFLIESMKVLAKNLGYSLIYTSIGIKPFINKLAVAGFIEADKNQTHMFYKIKRQENE